LALGLSAGCVMTAATYAYSQGGANAGSLLPVDRTVVAQAFGAGTIRDIAVEGNQRIETATVLSYLMVKAGEPFNADRIDESLKALFATGLFQDVVMKRRGDTLVVSISENPIVNRVAFEGNRRLDDDRLSSEVQIKPRQAFTRTRVQSEVQRIVELYRRQGRFATTVEPKIIQLDQNRVDLVFEIGEGPRTGVRAINFIGNEEFSEGTLREAIQTKESAWYRILSNDDNYDPDRLSFDREVLRRYYLREGYADFRVLSAVAELTPDRQDFVITFTIEEGPRYKFGKIDVNSALKNLAPEAVASVVQTKEGDWYDATEVDDSIDALTTAVADLQFPFVDVQPRIKRNKDDLTIDIAYDIAEGQRVYVERIDITGNVRTTDKVVRREMSLIEGDPFNNTKLKRSEQRVRDLGFFERVETTTEQGSAPDRAVVNVSVTEQSTGEIVIGAGYSTTDGVLGDFSIRERNLLGRGQDLRLGTTLSTSRQEIDLSFTEPYFLDRDLAAGFDLFRTSTDYQDESSYDERNTGFTLRVSYPLAERLRQRVYYKFADTSVRGVSSSASQFIKSETGTNVTSLIGQELSYDDLDSKLDPTKGWFVKVTTDLAGAGGTERYVRGRLSGGYYYPLTRSKDWVVSATSEIGTVQGMGKKVSLADRFFLGGDTMRGFKTSGIGPRDRLTGDSLGGKNFARGSVELAFPLGLPAEIGLRGYAFMDVGMLTTTGLSSSVIQDDASPRAAGGIGIAWKSPMGPIRVDIAKPFLKKNYDKTQAFRFSFGTRF
jgi:outer membrane protein insertion porin family